MSERAGQVLRSTILGWQLEPDGSKRAPVYAVSYVAGNGAICEGWAVWRYDRWYVSGERPRVDQEIGVRPA